MNIPQTQTALLQQNLQPPMDMLSSSKVYSRTSSRSTRRSRDRERVKKRHKTKSGRSRSRDRERKKRRHHEPHRDRDRNRNERRHRDRKRHDRDLRHIGNGAIHYNNYKSDRKRRRSPSLNGKNRKFKSHDLRHNKRRKLMKNGVVPPHKSMEMMMDRSNSCSTQHVTFDIQINNHENLNAVKDIKNLVSHSKNNTKSMNIAHIPNIPAVLQDNNINMGTTSVPKTQTRTVHGPLGNGTNSKRSKRKHRSNSRSASDGSTSSYSESDHGKEESHSTSEEEDDDDDDSESMSESSSSYSATDSEYTTDSSDSSSENEGEPAIDTKTKNRDTRDRDRRKSSKHHRDSRDKRSHRSTRTRTRNESRELRELRRIKRRRGPTPNWLRHQEKEWFKAMEMLTKFNHRKNYRDKFLGVFEQAVYAQFDHFWEDKSPETQEIKSLEVLFEKTYFEHFNSIRQVREYQQNIQRQQSRQAIIALNQTLSNGNAPGAPPASSSSYPQVQNIQNRKTIQPKIASNTTTAPPPQQDLLSMLNLGDNLNANIQNIQALLAMSAQQQQQQNGPRRTLRVPRLLQQNTAVVHHVPPPPVPVAPPPMMPAPMATQPPTVRKPPALRQQEQQQQKANSPPLAMIKLPAPAAMSVTTKPIMIIHETANNAMISLPPPANVPITMELVPPPETVVEQIDASTSISTTVEMDHPESNDSDMEEAEKSVTDEQICEVLNLPPPPKDPRLSKENTPSQMMNIDIDVEIEDECMSVTSVVSDVVTEDDIVIDSPDSKKTDDESTDSMSPEVPIERKRISDALHVTASSVPTEEEDDIDFEQTLNVLGDFLSNDNVKQDIQVTVYQDDQIKNATAMKDPQDNDIKMNVDPRIKPNASDHVDTAVEMKTNSTNVAAVNAMIGIETSWLFEDESDLDPGSGLPGMVTTNQASKVTAPAQTQAPRQEENVPTHFIPAPSYYNPPVPGQDIDRRQIKRDAVNTNANGNQLQPRRRAVRRRPKPNATKTDVEPAVTVKPASDDTAAKTVLPPKPKPRAAAKKRGFFNRIRKQGTGDTVDKSKMIQSRINPTIMKVNSNPKPKAIIPTHLPKRRPNNDHLIPKSASPPNMFHIKKDTTEAAVHPMWNIAPTLRNTKPKSLIPARVAKRRNKNLIPKATKGEQRMIDLTTASPSNAKNGTHKNKTIKSRFRPKPIANKAKKSMSLNTNTPPRSRSNTPSASVLAINKISKKSKSNDNLHRNMIPSKGRHYQELGPRLDAPPTDLSALFDSNPQEKKKIEKSKNPPPIANNPKPKNHPRRNNYYNPRGSGAYPPAPYYPPHNGHPMYPPPPHYARPQAPPPGYYPPNGYYPPPPNGYYAPPPPPYPGHPLPPHNNPMMPPPEMPEPNGRKYKKIANYRDNIFFPDGYKKWSKPQHMEHIDAKIHERTKLLLFLDIDHTILHSTRDKRGAAYVNHPHFGQDIFSINFSNQYNATYYIKFRPGFRRMIRELTPLYDFVLYTMGSRSYAEQVAMVIDEHFRQFTAEFQRNKHNRTFIIGNRIICREDHGNIADKDYKKDIAQFAPIEANWCMIIDDVPEVWRNRDDVHRVPKYLFWPNPDKTAPGTNHKHNDDTNNKINIWSKNSITSWNDDKSLLKQEKDNVLLQSIEMCKTVHDCYYAQYTPSNATVSAPMIFMAIRRKVMMHSHLVFTGVFPQKNARNDFHWKLAELFGANVSESITPQTTHLIGKESKTSKIQQAIRHDTIEIVHVNWLYQTFFNFGLADCNKFRMFINGDDKHTPKMHCFTKVKSKRELVAMYQQ